MTETNNITLKIQENDLQHKTLDNEINIPENIRQFVSSDMKNSVKLYCNKCDSIILNANNAQLVNIKTFMPFPQQKRLQKPEDVEGEVTTSFWHISGMFTFENVGFCRTIDTVKYLMCADCEIGPIGIHDTRKQEDFYVSTDRILHK